MDHLSESMKGLRDAIRCQEHQLTSFDNGKVFQDVQLFPKRDFIHDTEKQSNSFLNGFRKRQCSAESNLSQSSHWSCSLDTINSSVEELKVVLESQDKQVIRLITENEALKIEMKKMEKEIKKQKFLLKAERETFEKYKKDTFHEVKKHKSEESHKRPNKHAQEVIKLKSELAHYRQMFVEQSHTVKRMSKLVTDLKSDKILLKDKLLQQENTANKFIFEMGQRFYISRRDLNTVISKYLEEKKVPPSKLYKLTDRNACLSYDNSMLKLEVNMLKKELLEKRIKENKSEYLIGRSDNCNKIPNSFDIDDPGLVKCEDSETTIMLKSSFSEKSCVSNLSLKNYDYAVKTSVTSLINRNKKSVLTWQPEPITNSTSKMLSLAQPNSIVNSAEDVRLMRVCSAPQLTSGCNSQT